MPNSADMTSPVYNDGPVFYGPDGQVLTEEENSFLSSNVPSYPNISFEDLVEWVSMLLAFPKLQFSIFHPFTFSDDSDELVDDDDNAIDLEIQLAFKEFVNSNKNAAAGSSGNPSKK